MLVGLGGLAAFNKYEVIKAHLADKRSGGFSESTYDFNWGQ